MGAEFDGPVEQDLPVISILNENAERQWARHEISRWREDRHRKGARCPGKPQDLVVIIARGCNESGKANARCYKQQQERNCLQLLCRRLCSQETRSKSNCLRNCRKSFVKVLVALPNC